MKDLYSYDLYSMIIPPTDSPTPESNDAETTHIHAAQESNGDVYFQRMCEASPLGIFVSDAQGSCVYTNTAYHLISGQSMEETLGTNWTAAIHPDDRLNVIIDWKHAINNQEPFFAEVRFVRKDNTLVWIRLNAGVIRASSTCEIIQGYVQIVEDISDRKAMELIVRVSEDTFFEQQERAQVTLNSIGDGVLTANLGGKVSYLNRKAEAMTGWPLIEALGLPLIDVFNVVNKNDRTMSTIAATEVLNENKTLMLSNNCILIRRDGTACAIEGSIAPIHNRNNEVTGIVIVFHDETEKRTIANKMMHMAQHDFLTELPNRSLLIERLTQAIGFARRKKKKVGLLFIDLDNFKHINDSLGHASGDQLLQSVAKRLIEIVRTTDTVCRQGGDEFVILLTEIEEHKDAGHVAEKLITAFVTPHWIAEKDIQITLSIGISVYPDDCKDVEAAFQHADIAMYHAKMNGRNNFQFFNTDMKPHRLTTITVP